MFTKKNMIVIGLIAIFVLGAVALSAVTFQVVVHVQGTGSGSYESTNTNPVTVPSWNATNNITITDYLGAVFECEGNGGINGSTDYDEGTLYPNTINHFYLDLRPPQKDDGEPGGQ